MQADPAAGIAVVLGLVSGEHVTSPNGDLGLCLHCVPFVVSEDAILRDRPACVIQENARRIAGDDVPLEPRTGASCAPEAAGGALVNRQAVPAAVPDRAAADHGRAIQKPETAGSVFGRAVGRSAVIVVSILGGQRVPVPAVGLLLCRSEDDRRFHRALCGNDAVVADPQATAFRYLNGHPG